MFEFSVELKRLYNDISVDIQKRLIEFRKVPKEKYFYELVYCLCTPMSKAENAGKVQNIFEERNFVKNPFDPIPILSNPDNYIRFHNQKSKFILNALENFNNILEILESENTNYVKRELLVSNIKGIGYKEASHFLRNIGFFGLAILDRHILRNLATFNLIPKEYSVTTKKSYENIENIFVNSSKMINLEVEELDLLLWAKETGKILK
jgi:N-glycosylase/DNA lyase